ncbi:dihydroxyacetone kinase phosphoryl donor subunit DhaM [Parasphingorhabdus pacifica]
MSVGLVVVSHSRPLAEGVVELARQMAPEVRVVPAGGLPDGSVGTDFEMVSAALSDADSGSGAVLLYDLGSAQMTAELAVESLGDPSTAIVADGPLVEGAVAASVAAQGGGDLDGVARAVTSAGAPKDADQVVAGQVETESAGEESTAEPEQVHEELELRNEVGLHARPAAMLARTVADMRADVTVSLGDNSADAASVLDIMGLGARKGDRIAVRAGGPDAREAVRRIVELAQRNFDE